MAFRNHLIAQSHTPTQNVIVGVCLDPTHIAGVFMTADVSSSAHHTYMLACSKITSPILTNMLTNTSYPLTVLVSLTSSTVDDIIDTKKYDMYKIYKNNNK